MEDQVQFSHEECYQHQEAVDQEDAAECKDDDAVCVSEIDWASANFRCQGFRLDWLHIMLQLRRTFCTSVGEDTCLDFKFNDYLFNRPFNLT